MFRPIGHIVVVLVEVVMRNPMTVVFSFAKLLLLVSFISCRPSDPVGELNRLVSEYGFIGYQNPLENASTGTLIAGTPTSMAFVAPANDCFPEEEIPRYYDQSNINKKYQYNFVGNLGFLTNGNPILSAGFGLDSSHVVNVELNGITIEYMSSIDITDYYLDGMSETCKLYLDDVGFVIQALSTDSMKLSVQKIKGTKIELDAENVSQFFQFGFGVNYQIVDEYTVEVTSTKYIGYQLGRLRLSDEGRTLYRASSVVDDKFYFESIGVFQDEEEEAIISSIEAIESGAGSEIDANAVYVD